MLRSHLAAPLLVFSLLPASAQDYDLVIRGGNVLDGSGRPAVAADVAVRGDRIVGVGKIAGQGRAEISAAGQVVAPGFIDVHTHSEDLTELPVAENFLRMGVTTIISGNCGGSKLNVAEFFDAIAKTRVALNIATLIGQGTVRGQVMGGSFMRPATAEELEKMRELVARAMQDGAVGLSTGLIYLPGTFTRTEEIVELAKVAGAHGGIYASHMRYEDARIRAALDEITTIGREGRVPVHVSHLKLSTPAAWGRADEIIAFLDGARAGGLTVTQDQYAYTASSTGIGANLIPARFREGGGFRERLADPAEKARMVAAMKEAVEKEKRGDYAFAVIARFRTDPKLNGKNIAQAAKILRGADSLDDQIETILDLEARGGAQGVFHGMSEADLRKFIVMPTTMVASDAGPRRFGEAVPHPRGYGNNARVLGRYVRELQLLPLEEAVRKMTALPAGAFRLKNRGAVQPGCVADLVIFDPAKVSDPSTFGDPHHYAVGFSHIIVNGAPVIRDGQLTGARPGRAVRLKDE